MLVFPAMYCSPSFRLVSNENSHKCLFLFKTGTGKLVFVDSNITVSESDTNPVLLCVELDLTSAVGNSLGCDLTVTLSIVDGTNAGI